MSDFDRIFDQLSKQDRVELAARTGYEIGDALADRIRAAGAGLVGHHTVEFRAGSPGDDGNAIIWWSLSGWPLSHAFDAYLIARGLPRAAMT